jgi:uncharacterized protein YqhQ
MGCNNKNTPNPRLGTVGGQAVMEGVMMKSKTTVATAVRKYDGSITVKKSPVKSIKNKHKIFRVPLIRGIVNFVEMMILSFSTLSDSAQMLGIEMEEPGKFGKWLEKRFGKSIMTLITALSVVLGVVLAFFLFIWLPAFVTKLINRYIVNLGGLFTLVEGLFKMAIFVSYILLVSLMKDIKRVFSYHGAEHKSIFAYEAGEELTVENVKAKSRFHPRCGTSFIFVLLIISILVGAVLPKKILLIRVALRLLTFPVVVGIGYEYIIYVGKHSNALTRIFSAPGLWMQRVTTKEPDDKMIEVAIAALKSALPDEFPGFEVTSEKTEETIATDDANQTQETVIQEAELKTEETANS